MLDKIKEDLKKAITEFTIEDFNIYTMNELYMQVAKKTNEVIEIVKLLQDYLNEQIFNDVENIEIKQQILENVFNQLIINAGNSNAEIVDARVEADGTTHRKLGDRLNSIDSQIKDIAYVIGKSNGTDDTLMFQEAIDKVNSTNGGRIYVPAGTYYVNSLVINKATATKIIIQGQSQKTDSFFGHDETVKIIHIGNDNENLITVNGVTVYIEGIAFMGDNKRTNCIIANNNRLTSLYRCKVYNFNVGIEFNTSTHYINECEITANKIGIKMFNSGDGMIINSWINTNGHGVAYNQYCSNSQIRGGKIEWNDKGISTLSGGIIISNIQFDYNKEYDISIVGTLFGKHEFAVYPDNIFGITIEGNRFLGSGYAIENDISNENGCCIKANTCSEITIIGNSFTSGGRWAQDNGGLEDIDPTHLVGPYRTFIKCHKSMLLVTGNTFNSQYNIPPLIITDNTYISEVNYTGNRCLNNKKPGIWDYGTDNLINKKQTLIYSDMCGYKTYYNPSKPIIGTFNENDRIYSTNSNEIWICKSKGTLRDVSDLNVVATSGENTIILSRDIKANELKVGDILYLGDTLKVTKISYKDSDKATTEIPTVYVDKRITVNYNGIINFLKPSFVSMDNTGVISAGNTDIVIADYYKILNIQSDSSEVNVTFDDKILYDGFEIIIRCAWVVNNVNLKTDNLGTINTITSSNGGWYKAIFYNNKFKLIQLDSNLN